MRANEHPKNAERLKALDNFNIVDTPPEEVFDDLVKLAAEICEMPVSLISLVETERQWFKASIGFDGAETPITESICSHVILENDAVVQIPDTRTDPRTADNPHVTGLTGIRSYAGAQLNTAEGLPLGTLCVLGTEPRELTPFQRNALRVLAKQVMTQLELRRALRNQEILRNEMDHRVKNSLQTVQSLIQLYRRKVTDPQAHDAFDAVERRLQAIIMLHKELHNSSSMERVKMVPFLDGIINLLARTLPDNISLEHSVDAVDLTSAQASAVAVIISEFVANGIKHAFPEGRNGKISITLHADADKVVVTCRDNGVGTSLGKKAPKTDQIENLGTLIMEASADQIGGTLERSKSKDGFGLTLRFKPQ